MKIYSSSSPPHFLSVTQCFDCLDQRTDDDYNTDDACEKRSMERWEPNMGEHGRCLTLLLIHDGSPNPMIQSLDAAVGLTPRDQANKKHNIWAKHTLTNHLEWPNGTLDNIRDIGSLKSVH